MGLDIRLPIGLMFTLIGAMLTVFGLLSDAAIYARSLGHNVNLWWGLVLFVFGVIFIYYGQRGTKELQARRPVAPAVELPGSEPPRRGH